MPSISSSVPLSVIAVAGLFQSLATGAPIPTGALMARQGGESAVFSAPANAQACSGGPGESGVGCYTFKPAPITFPPGQ